MENKPVSDSGTGAGSSQTGFFNWALIQPRPGGYHRGAMAERQRGLSFYPGVPLPSVLASSADVTRGAYTTLPPSCRCSTTMR